MLTKMRVIPSWELWLVRAQMHIGRTVDTTCLAVVLSRNIEINQIKYHFDEAGHPRNRVDLRRRKVRPELCNET
jgi:hypothetical protein